MQSSSHPLAGFVPLTRLDLYTIGKIRSLSKKQRRMRRDKFENKFEKESFRDQLSEKHKRDEEKNRQARINDLIQDIKALQMIGADVSIKKKELNDILKNKK